MRAVAAGNFELATTLLTLGADPAARATPTNSLFASGRDPRPLDGAWFWHAARLSGHPLPKAFHAMAMELVLLGSERQQSPFEVLLAARPARLFAAPPADLTALFQAGDLAGILGYCRLVGAVPFQALVQCMETPVAWRKGAEEAWDEHFGPHFPALGAPGRALLRQLDTSHGLCASLSPAANPAPRRPRL